MTVKEIDLLGDGRVLLSHDDFMNNYSLGASLERCQKNFCYVWSSIPDVQRERIYKQWLKASQKPRLLYTVFDYPGEPKYGCIEGGGNSFKIFHSEINEFPDDAYYFIIAHELGHIYQHACGIKSVSQNFNSISYVDKEGFPWGDTKAHEADADRLAKAWGFDKSAFLFAQRSFESVKPQKLFKLSFEATLEGTEDIYAESEDQAKEKFLKAYPEGFLSTEYFGYSDPDILDVFEDVSIEGAD